MRRRGFLKQLVGLVVGATAVAVVPRPVEQPIEKIEKLKLRTITIDYSDFSRFVQSPEGERLFIETISRHKPVRPFTGRFR